MIVHARVKGGRLVVDEPVDLPEGKEVDLEVVDWLDDVPREEREALLASIDRGIAQFDRGEPGIPAEDVLRRLRES